jgi:CheY-like chemotaxis protein
VIELQFSVTDTGIGIPPDKLDSIFHNFTQADSSTTRKYGGSGLGLAIAHRLVELMGGRMTVESEPGKGSRFSFTAGFSRVPATDNPVLKSSLGLTGCRVLIADHSRASRRAVREMFDGSGAQISEASNGTSALRSMLNAAEEGRPYHIVLLDMAMPSLDLFDVAERLRTSYINLKSLIPMLTSNELKLQIGRLQQLGLSHYVVKPLTRKSLLASIKLLADELPSGLIPVTEKAPGRLHGGATILVAEDSADNRLVIAAYLQHEPYQIHFAEDGKQAFGKFIASAYDLVLMDIQMPEMDGLDATRAIRRWESEQGLLPTPIVALTAYALEEDVRRVLAAGCDLHVSKPLKKQVLIDCIQKAIHAGRPNDTDRQLIHPCYYS